MASDTRSKLTAAEKRNEALRLRTMGSTYADIAERVGYANKGSACRAVSQAIKDIPREAAEEARELEVGRLDALQNAVMPAALRGDVLAVDRAVKVIESRSKLLGLYDLKITVDPGAVEAAKALTDFLHVAQQQAAPAPTPLPTSDEEATA